MYLNTLDEQTIERIKACKKAEFPICLEQGILEIFKESLGKQLFDNIVEKLAPSGRPRLASSQEVWKIYGEALELLSSQLGNNVSRVIDYQSMKEAEKMGCSLCPLYQKQVSCKNILSTER